VILSNPLTILWIAIPLFIQTNLIFWLGYGLAKVLKLSYADAAQDMPSYSGMVSSMQTYVTFTGLWATGPQMLLTLPDAACVFTG